MACAASCMGLTSYLGNPTFDAIGSLLVGGLLGGVASFIIYTNVAALIGRSIPQENLDKINAELESDIMVTIEFFNFIFILRFYFFLNFVLFIVIMNLICFIY